MEITQEALAERKDKLVAQMQEKQAQMQDLNNAMNAISGAIQDCEYWLGVISEP